ncbi:MAG: histidinol phosphatase [Candidatus Omnitrophica bacterium]|nr:histidinol phosphatase [Candidatus Omnitrophota bacterium]
MTGNQRTLLAWLEREVRSCRPTALRYFRSASLRVDRKPDQSPVTAADRAVEERLRRALSRACAGEAVIGEEFGATGRPGSSYWTVDPIDGTRAFSRGLPTWAILIAKVEGGRPVLGLCDFPALGITLGVARGVPAFERERGRLSRLRPPRRTTRLADAVLLHGGLRWWPARQRMRDRFIRLTHQCFLERSYGDAYGYLWALRGYADIVVDYGVKVWDMAPLAALAAATGRVMTDFSGRPSWTGPDTVFGSPSMVRHVVRALHA